MIGVQCNAIKDNERVGSSGEAIKKASDGGKAEGIKDSKHAMGREEFVEALVRIAMKTYIRPGVEDSVDAALGRLCRHLESRLPPEALQNSNEFRKAKCYNAHTDSVLLKHKESLKALFKICESFADRQTEGEEEFRTV